MVEIAISLAIIGIALVSIIGVLPIGMNTQRDNREETVINQDATVLLEAIRSGARGLDDLTNYVFAITNYWTLYNANGIVNSSSNNGYIYNKFSIAPGYYYPPAKGAPIDNGRNIIGLLSTPEYADLNGLPIPNLLNGGYSNRVYAYVRSLSGPAAERPPQNNDILREGSFSYRLLCVNAPITMQLPVLWASGSYTNGSQVYWKYKNWIVSIPGNYPPSRVTTQEPGLWDSFDWKWVPYPQQLDANLRELRLTFFWPLLPNNQVGQGRQTFRTLIAGQIIATNLPVGQTLYFYQSQSFLNVNNAL